MNPVESNLARYLKLERLLNDLFAAFNFCFDSCVKLKRMQNGGLPVAVCCMDKYYVLFDLEHEAYERLRQERERLYGKPCEHTWLNPASPCEYHDPENGCILKTHKSPTCIAFLCRKAIDRLRTQFDIFFYDYLGVTYALEWVLTGILSEREYRELETDILAAIAKIKKRQSGVAIKGRPLPHRYR